MLAFFLAIAPANQAVPGIQFIGEIFVRLVTHDAEMDRV
jgi:hypothetical protein